MSQILITRSAPHSQRIRQLLSEEGFSSRCVTVLETQATPLGGAEKNHLYNFDLFDLVIIISANAAQYLANHLDTIWPQTPSHPKWLCIGQATQRALLTALDDIDPTQVAIPDGTDSEALLNHPFVQSLNDQKVLIVKGQGGRALIEHSLQQQGARVTTLELYHRTCPDNHKELIKALAEDALQFIQIASGDSYKHFISLLATALGFNAHDTLSFKTLLAAANGAPTFHTVARTLTASVWIVPSQRIKDLMIHDGVEANKIDVSEGASDQALLARLCQLV